MTHGGPAKRKANKNVDENNMIEEFPAPPDGGWGKSIMKLHLLFNNFMKLHLLANRN